MDNPGKALVIVGIGLAGFGGLIWLLQSLFGVRLGRLPGDITLQKPGFSFLFPVTTMLLLSAIATLAIWLIRTIRR